MPHPLARISARGLAALIVLCCALPSLADDKSATEYSAAKYKETGTVLSVTSKHGHFYQVATDSRVYLLMCVKVKSIQLGMPECKVGDKPIAVGDSVHFRLDKDWAYMPPASGGDEEKLRILTTELKDLPKDLPATPAGKNLKPGTESGVVIGTGVHVHGQHGAGWSTTPASAPTTASVAGPVMPTAPVTAVPVTGGPPVVVVPTAPTTGGVVTGIPVTGGAPVTAIPTAPVTGIPVAGAPAGGTVMLGGSAPQWVHVLRIQTAAKIYQLECSTKPCVVGVREIQLGDAIAVRTEKNSAYLIFPQNLSEEQKYKILSVTPVGAESDSKPK